MEGIYFQREEDPGVDEVTALYRCSGLGERRPIGVPEVMEAMVRNADLIVTARKGGRLIGVSRTLTDFAYVAYLADLAVDQAFHGSGVGRRLVTETVSHLEPTCFLTLLSAPAANGFYPKIGFESHPRAWVARAASPPPLGDGDC